MNVKVRLEKTSQVLNFENLKNTYQKGSFYCIYKEDNVVKKIPIDTISNIDETY